MQTQQHSTRTSPGLRHPAASGPVLRCPRLEPRTKSGNPKQYRSTRCQRASQLISMLTLRCKTKCRKRSSTHLVASRIPSNLSSSPYSLTSSDPSTTIWITSRQSWTSNSTETQARAVAASGILQDWQKRQRSFQLHLSEQLSGSTRTSWPTIKVRKMMISSVM